MRKRIPGFAACLLLVVACACSDIVPAGPGGTWRTFTEADGLADNTVHGVAVDAQGNAWFATDGGVSVLSVDGTWDTYSAGSDGEATRATDVVVDGRDRVWVSITGGGVSRFDGKAWKTFNTADSGLPDDYPLQVAADSKNNVWVLSREGLSVIHDDGTTSFVEAPPTSTWSGGLGGSIAIDPEGHIWIGEATSATLIEYEPGEKRWSVVGRLEDHVEISHPRASRVFLWGLAVDQQGRLWIAANAIVEVDGDSWRVYETQYTPLSVFVDAYGNKWFGMGSGEILVLAFDNHTWWRYGATSGWGVESMNDMAYDARRGSYWFGTDEGVVQFTPAR